MGRDLLASLLLVTNLRRPFLHCRARKVVQAKHFCHATLRISERQDLSAATLGKQAGSFQRRDAADRHRVVEMNNLRSIDQ